MQEMLRSVVLINYLQRRLFYSYKTTVKTITLIQNFHY